MAVLQERHSSFDPVTLPNEIIAVITSEKNALQCYKGKLGVIEENLAVLVSDHLLSGF